MLKSSDLLKLFVVISTVEFCCSMAIGEEPNFDVVSVKNLWKIWVSISRISLQYDQEVNGGWVPVPASYFSAPNYIPSNYIQNRFYPSHHEKFKFVVAPSKRNSELINSLLGLPKNMDAAGKWKL